MESSLKPGALRAGEQLLEAGRYQEAIARFEELLEQNPEDVDCLANLGVAALLSGDVARGVELHLRALCLAPAHEALLGNVASLVKEPEIRDYTSEFLDRLLQHDTLDVRRRNAAAILGHLLDADGFYRAAHASLNITPDVSSAKPVAVQGYVIRTRAAQAVASPLLLQLLLIEDRSGSRALFIAADLFGLDDEAVAQIRHAAREWGISPEGVVINASHTHYAPGTVGNVSEKLGPYNRDYVAKIVASITRVLPKLHDDLQPCFLYAAHAQAKIGANRRVEIDGTIEFGVNEDGYYHESTPLLMVDFIRSGSSVMLVSHGCHPTGLGAAPVISAGFPGFAREYLTAAHVADHVMFLQGPGGSTKPTVCDEGKERFTRKRPEVAFNGRQLAASVVAALNEPLRPVRGSIFARIDRANLSIDETRSAGEPDKPADNPADCLTTREGARKREASNGGLEVEIQFIALDQRTCFVTMPGEPVGELARKLLRNTELPSDSFILGYTNGLKAYLPTTALIKEGGYEVDGAAFVYRLPGPFQPNSDDAILNTVASQLHHWRAGGRPNGYGRYHLEETQGAAFFCLSSGRCGTQTLAHLLASASNARVYHHPKPFLIEETLAAYHQVIDAAGTFWRARGGAIRDAWKDGLVFGALDHNMTAFAPAISKELDHARFIVLVRSPWDFVRSGMRRGYYRGHGWDAGRLRPEVNHVDATRWPSLTPFEKTCWLWNDTYRRIRRFIEGLPDESYRIVRFEELTRDVAVARNLYAFLGLQGFDARTAHAVIGKKLNAQTSGDFPRPQEWVAPQHDVLERECAEQIRFFGYERPGTAQRLVG